MIDSREAVGFTFDELAQQWGIKRPSARMRAKRAGLKFYLDSDGRVRVAVPVSALDRLGLKTKHISTDGGPRLAAHVLARVPDISDDVAALAQELARVQEKCARIARELAALKSLTSAKRMPAGEHRRTKRQARVTRDALP